MAERFLNHFASCAFAHAFWAAPPPERAPLLHILAAAPALAEAPRACPARPEADLLVWCAVRADHPDGAADLHTRYAARSAPLRAWLQPTASLRGFTAASWYHPGESPRLPDAYDPERRRYPVIRPFAEPGDWRQLGPESPQARMSEQIPMSREYPGLAQLLLRCIGLANQECVVCETAERPRFPELVVARRSADRRPYAPRRAPITTPVWRRSMSGSPGGGSPGREARCDGGCCTGLANQEFVVCETAELSRFPKLVAALRSADGRPYARRSAPTTTAVWRRSMSGSPGGGSPGWEARCHGGCCIGLANQEFVVCETAELPRFPKLVAALRSADRRPYTLRGTPTASAVWRRSMSGPPGGSSPGWEARCHGGCCTGLANQEFVVRETAELPRFPKLVAALRSADRRPFTLRGTPTTTAVWRRSMSGSPGGGDPVLDVTRPPLLLCSEPTRACELSWRHCRAEAAPRRDPNELITGERLRLPHQPGDFGDPPERFDPWEPIAAACGRGILVAITPAITARFAEAGIWMMAVSLDGSRPMRHHGVPMGAGSVAHIEQTPVWAQEAGLLLQVYTLVCELTAEGLSAIYDLITGLDAARWSLFSLIRVGPGKGLEEVSPACCEETMAQVLQLQAEGGADLKTTEAPDSRRVALEEKARPAEDVAQGIRRGFGIRDGAGGMFVSRVGEVLPAGSPQIVAGTERETSPVGIYQSSRFFTNVRDMSRVRGKGGECEHNVVCGGSRARALACTGDALESDPLYPFIPEGVAA